MKSLEPRTQALLRATRRADEPTDEQLHRVRHSLAAKIAVGGAAAAGLQAVSSSATGAASSGLVTKLLLLPTAIKVSLSVAVLGLGALGGWKVAASMHDARVPTPSVATTQLAEPAPAAVAQPATPTVTPEPDMNPSDDRHELSATPSARVTPHPARQPAVSGPELQEEAKLLSDVQSALGAGQGSKALEKLNDYDQRFPGGVLRAEADAARVFALCQSGRRADAQAAARRFLRRYPSSPSASRVQQACVAEDPGPKTTR